MWESRKVIFDIILKRNYWLILYKYPILCLKTVVYTLKYPNFYKIALYVKGLISLPLAILLYESVIKSRKFNSPNIIEVGAFQGKSTAFLSLGANKIGKRIKTFELFTGLPVIDTTLDYKFKVGQYSSDKDVFVANIGKYGCKDVVDLTIGDARENILSVIGTSGFCFAFLDVDVYEVMKDLLFKLLSISHGGEVILIHDSDSPGIRKAIDEVCKSNVFKIEETFPMLQTSRLVINM